MARSRDDEVDKERRGFIGNSIKMLVLGAIAGTGGTIATEVCVLDKLLNEPEKETGKIIEKKTEFKIPLSDVKYNGMVKLETETVTGPIYHYFQEKVGETIPKLTAKLPDDSCVKKWANDFNRSATKEDIDVDLCLRLSFGYKFGDYMYSEEYKKEMVKADTKKKIITITVPPLEVTDVEVLLYQSEDNLKDKGYFASRGWLADITMTETLAALGEAQKLAEQEIPATFKDPMNMTQDEQAVMQKVREDSYQELLAYYDGIQNYVSDEGVRCEDCAIVLREMSKDEAKKYKEQSDATKAAKAGK